MIPYEFRLKKERNFDILFQEGEFISGQGVDIKYWRIDTEKYKGRFKEDDLKIGFVVSSKISNKATVRNKKKRQMREAVRDLIDKKEFKRGFLAALVAREEILDMDFAQLKEDIKNLLKKSGIIK